MEGSDRSVVIAAPDQPRLFSRVVGVLGLSGQDVRAARRALDRRRGRDLRVRHRARLRPSRPTGPRSRPTSARALAGASPIDAAPRRARRALRAPAPPDRGRAARARVIVDNDASAGRDLRRGARRRRHRRALPDHAHVRGSAARHPSGVRVDPSATRSSTPSTSSPRTGRSSRTRARRRARDRHPIHARPARLTWFGPDRPGRPAGRCQSSVRYMSKIGNDRHTEAKPAVPNLAAHDYNTASPPERPGPPAVLRCVPGRQDDRHHRRDGGDLGLHVVLLRPRPARSACTHKRR